MKFIVGEKKQMTQIFDEEGRVHPATILSVGPAVITQIKTKEKDGYSAIQVGYGNRRRKNIPKPQQGHAGKLGDFEGFTEFRFPTEDQDAVGEYSVGKAIDVSSFEAGDMVTLSAISKGKGFQGVVKRHGFHGGPRTHGQKHSERSPGSIGAQGPQRVFKGKKMPGRMGGDKVTLRKVRILAVDTDNNLLVVRGSVPGRRGTLVEIRGVHAKQPA